MNNFTIDLKQESLVDTGAGTKIRTFRREQSKFFVEFNDWMKNSNVGVVTAFAQSESNGWITLTLCYFEKQDPEKAVLDPSVEAIQKCCIALENCVYLIEGLADRLGLLASPKTPPLSDLALREEPGVDTYTQHPG